MISLEEFQEAYADNHGGQEYEEPDPSQNVEETVERELRYEYLHQAQRKGYADP